MADEGRSKISYLLERLAQGVAAHDRENPDHHSWGVGMSHFDIERLGLEEGEHILPGIILQADVALRARSACCATETTTRSRKRLRKRSSMLSPRRHASLRSSVPAVASRYPPPLAHRFRTQDTEPARPDTV